MELDSDPEVMRYLTGPASPALGPRSSGRTSGASPPHGRSRGWVLVGFLADGQFVGWWILQPPH